MEKNLYSNAWYRVAGLRPFIRRHAQIHRHTYRGRVWYILQDHSTGRFHRFSQEAYIIIGLMDGKRSLQEIWEAACDQLKNDMPTQDDVIALLSQLYQADVLQADIPPDMENLNRRQRKEKRARIVNSLRSPLAVRIPLFDPDRFLEKTKKVVSPLFSLPGAIVWLVLVASAVILAFMHWTELTSSIADRVLALENIFFFWLIYPLVKGFHEFGHAYAVKRWGGEVHEMGIMFLVFIPMPYLDASAASAFREKRKRVLVGAAGIMIELLIASAAMILWVNAETGAVRAVAYNVMIVAGISTIFFNGNPLLRFDAYYILSDLLEIPNLGIRSSRYIGYLAQYYLLKNKDARFTLSDKGEASWLIIYGLASFAYRVFITIRIALFVAGKFFFVGVAIALWALIGLILVPFFKMGRRILVDRELFKRRGLIAMYLSAAAIISTLIITVIPLPYFTSTEGVLWPPEQTRLHAGADGTIAEVFAEPGSEVRAGDLLIRCENAELACEVKLLEAKLRECRVRYRIALVNDRTGQRILRDEILRTSEELARAKDRYDALSLRSKADGIFLLPYADDLPGRFVRRGAPLGYVIDHSSLRVRVVVPQAAVDKVRTNVRKVETRLSGDIRSRILSRLIREMPAASRALPSLALSLEGGGSIALDPLEKERPVSFKQLFQFEVGLPDFTTGKVGERVYVRFEHDPESLACRWYRSIRRLFLRRFDV